MKCDSLSESNARRPAEERTRPGAAAGGVRRCRTLVGRGRRALVADAPTRDRRDTGGVSVVAASDHGQSTPATIAADATTAAAVRTWFQTTHRRK